MREAIVNANSDRLNELIDQVAKDNAPLATGLRDLVNLYEYGTLLDLFAAGGTEQ